MFDKLSRCKRYSYKFLAKYKMLNPVFDEYEVFKDMKSYEKYKKWKDFGYWKDNYLISRSGITPSIKVDMEHDNKLSRSLITDKNNFNNRKSFLNNDLIDENVFKSNEFIVEVSDQSFEDVNNFNNLNTDTNFTQTNLELIGITQDLRNIQNIDCNTYLEEKKIPFLQDDPQKESNCIEGFNLMFNCENNVWIAKINKIKKCFSPNSEFLTDFLWDDDAKEIQYDYDFDNMFCKFVIGVRISFMVLMCWKWCS